MADGDGGRVLKERLAGLLDQSAPLGRRARGSFLVRVVALDELSAHIEAEVLLDCRGNDRRAIEASQRLM
ncbi:hypothetical protein ASD00_35545 [Ensifer sp. Root31]|nr:hypothetical protein ASD00_35545 [Ensifer sp. Root31]